MGMKRLMIAAVAALMACHQGGEDCFTRFCREAEENFGAQLIRLEGAGLGMARAFMGREVRRLMKALDISRVEMLLTGTCEENLRRPIVDGARALLGGDGYEKVPAGGDGNSVYLEKGDAEGSFTALVFLFEGEGVPYLCRLCGDISPGRLDGLIL